MEDRVPAETFPPGEYIRDELEARGWTVADLAGMLGESVATIGEVLEGRGRITPEAAERLADVFGTGAHVWLNLEARHRLRAPGPAIGLAGLSALNVCLRYFGCTS